MQLSTPVILYLLLINLFAFALMGIDKEKARRHKWRIPEKTLFLSALLGGSVNLSTIAGLDSNADTTWQKVKFTINASDGTTTVATVTP